MPLPRLGRGEFPDVLNRQSKLTRRFIKVPLHALSARLVSHVADYRTSYGSLQVEPRRPGCRTSVRLAQELRVASGHDRRLETPSVAVARRAPSEPGGRREESNAERLITPGEGASTCRPLCARSNRGHGLRVATSGRCLGAPRALYTCPRLYGRLTQRLRSDPHTGSSWEHFSAHEGRREPQVVGDAPGGPLCTRPAARLRVGVPVSFAMVRGDLSIEGVEGSGLPTQARDPQRSLAP